MKNFLWSMLIALFCVWNVTCYATPTYDASGYWEGTEDVYIASSQFLGIPAWIGITQDNSNSTFTMNWATGSYMDDLDPFYPYVFGTIDGTRYDVTTYNFANLGIGPSFPEHDGTGFFIIGPGGLIIMADMDSCTINLTSPKDSTVTLYFTLSDDVTFESNFFTFCSEPSVWFEDSRFEGITGRIEGTFAKVAPVPEPATMLLLGAGLAGLASTRIRRKKRQVGHPIFFLSMKKILK